MKNTCLLLVPVVLRRFKALPVGLLTIALWTLCGANARAVAPPNDDIANATVVSGASGRVSATTVDATKQPGEPDHAGNIGGKSIWFQWSGAAASTRFDTVGTGFDTLIAIYQTNASGLVLVSANDEALDYLYLDNGGYHQSRAAFTAAASTTYFIAVDGYNNGSGAQSGPIFLNWNQTSGLPANDAFASATVLTGTEGGVGSRNHNATKQAGEPTVAGNAGGKSVWFSWTAPSNGEAVFDTMGSSLDTIMGVYIGTAVNALSLVVANDDSLADANGNPFIAFSRVTFSATAGTTYRITVDGYAGGSGSIALHYSFFGTAPTNDNFASAAVISGVKGQVAGRNNVATVEAGEPTKAGSSGGRSVWYRWTAPADGQTTFDLFGVQWDTILGVFIGNDVGTLVSVAENDDSLPGACLNSRASFYADAGGVYYIVVDGYAGTTTPADYGSFTLNWEQAATAPNNDRFSAALDLTGDVGTITTSNTTAVVEENEPVHGILDDGTIVGLGGKSLWFRWTPAHTRDATIDLAGSTFDTFLEVYTGTAFDNLVYVTNNDDTVSPPSLTSGLVIPAVAGTTYYIAVDGINLGTGRGAESGTVVLNYSQPGGAPPNDNFNSPTVLAGVAGQTNGANIDATAEPAEPEHAAFAPVSSVWFIWTAPQTGWFTFDSLANTTLDTVLAVYTGDSFGGLLEITSNDDADAVVQSRVSFLAVKGTTYRIALDSKAPTQGQYTLRWRPTVQIAGTPQANNHLQLTVTAATSGTFELQDSTDLVNWNTFDSVQFPNPDGGTALYDAGVIGALPKRFIRAKQ